MLSTQTKLRLREVLIFGIFGAGMGYKLCPELFGVSGVIAAFSGSFAGAYIGSWLFGDR